MSHADKEKSLEDRLLETNEKLDKLITASSDESRVRSSNAATSHPSESNNKSLPTNASEFAGFALNKLGKLGMPILVLGILLGGYLGIQEVFSTINERDESVRKTFTETAIATLDVGKSVVENTEKLITLNERLGDTGKRLLKLQIEASDEAEKAAKEKRIAEAATQKTELLRKKLSKKEKELKILRSDLEDKHTMLQVEQHSLAKKRGEIDLAMISVAEREKLLRDKDSEINIKSSMISDLKRSKDKLQEEQIRTKKEMTTLRTELENLESSLNETKRQKDELLNQLAIAMNGDKISVSELSTLGDPEPRKLKIDVLAELLSNYARNPNSVAKDAWMSVDGEMIPEDLNSLLKRNLGYERVLRFDISGTIYDQDVFNDLRIYFPVLQTTSNQVRGIVYIKSSRMFNTVEVESPATSITFIRHRDLNDFNHLRASAVVEVGLSVDAFHIKTQNTSRILLSDLLKEILTENFIPQETPTSSIHWGSIEPSIKILELTNAAKEFPSLVERWMEGDERIRLADKMEKRMIGFEANKLVPIKLFGTETSLRTTLVQLLDSSVYGDQLTISPLLAEPLTVEDIGRLAAISLRGELHFTAAPDVQVAQIKANEEPLIDEAKATPELNATIPAANATIFATITQPDLAGEDEEVEFRFRRTSGSQQWKLIGFGGAART